MGRDRGRVQVYVRHAPSCPNSRAWHSNAKCPTRCKLWLSWSYQGKQYRVAARTRILKIARDRADQIEALVAEMPGDLWD